MIDQQRGIVTPEAVVLEFETAGVASRAIAFLVDLFVMLVVYYVIAMIVMVAFAPAATFSGEGSDAATTLATVLLTISAFLVLFGYPALMETFVRGRTVGKLMCGLRVVTTEGAPVRFRHAALRAIFMVVEVYLTLGTLAVTSIVLTRDNQRLGDVFGGTIVLRERTGEARSIAVRFPAPIGYEDYVMRLDTASVSRDLYLVVRRFLMRVGELAPTARAALAVDLAAPTARRMNHVPPPEISAEVFLACVASAYQLRNGAPPLPWERLPGLTTPAYVPPPAHVPTARPGPGSGTLGHLPAPPPSSRVATLPPPPPMAPPPPLAPPSAPAFGPSPR